MPELTIIIPTKDRGGIFFKTLNQIVESSSQHDVEILVINNSAVPLRIENKPANVFIYDNPNDKNSVFSSRNYGASIAKSPILLFVDDDILVSRNAIDYAITFHSQNSKACLNVNWEYPPELIEKIKDTVFGNYIIKSGFSSMRNLYKGKEWKDDKPFVSMKIASFFFGIMKCDFDKIGGYNEKHLYEGTDVDLSKNLNNNRITIWINPLIMVYHNEEDRVDIVNWLERKRRLGAILRNSVILGDKTQALHYPLFKRTFYGIIYYMQPMILSIIKMLDRWKIGIGGYKLVDLLLGVNMCNGYYSIKQ